MNRFLKRTETNMTLCLKGGIFFGFSSVLLHFKFVKCTYNMFNGIHSFITSCFFSSVFLVDDFVELKQRHFQRAAALGVSCVPETA